MNLKQTGLKLLSVFLCLGMLSACQKKEELRLKDEFAAYQEEGKAIEIEFGDDFIIEPASYLSEETSDELLEKVESGIYAIDEDGNATNEMDSSSRLDVGTYMIVMTVEKMRVEIPLQVSDTTAPEFVDFKETLEYEAGSEAVDFKTLFEAEDLSKVTVDVVGEVDFAVAGEYVLTVVAEDEHGNKIERTCTVTITEKPEEPKSESPSGNSSGNKVPSGENQSSGGGTNETPTTQQPSGGNTSEPPVTQPSVSLSQSESQVLTLVNQQRAAAGLAPLSIDANLQAAAEIRAQEISTSEANFSHTRPNGLDCFSAITDRYSYKSLGENIAGGYSSASAVMEGWMASDGHRENILKSTYTHIGIACYQGADGQLYWVQLFGRK